MKIKINIYILSRLAGLPKWFFSFFVVVVVVVPAVVSLLVLVVQLLLPSVQKEVKGEKKFKFWKKWNL